MNVTSSVPVADGAGETVAAGDGLAVEGGASIDDRLGCVPAHAATRTTTIRSVVER
jgi:hypothetical protein